MKRRGFFGVCVAAVLAPLSRWVPATVADDTIAGRRMSPWIDGRSFSVEEIARAYRISPKHLRDLQHTSTSFPKLRS